MAEHQGGGGGGLFPATAHRSSTQNPRTVNLVFPANTSESGRTLQDVSNMGKRKKSSRKPVGPKKKELLPTVFQCLFCNHEKSVTVKLDRKAGIGYASCKVCGQSHQCPITFLDQAVDVYANWVDAAEAVNQGGGDAAETADYAHAEQEAGYRGTARAKGTAEEGGGGGYDADDGFVVEDEVDGEAEYDDAE